jgi:SAM-dependent methyltransferase
VEGLSLTATLPSPYDAPELYDLVLDSFSDDLPFWLEEAKRARGPVLELACGTGRVLLHLRGHGVDADGLDLSAPMLSRLRHKAAARGLAVRALEADMRDFTLPRRYGAAFIAFNGFAHCETTEDQLRCLRCCREHLEPGGALVVDMSYPGPAYWTAPDQGRVLEMEVPHPDSGHPVRMYDTRTKDPLAQRQHSIVEIEELDGAGGLLRAHRFETTQRWVYRYELELLFRCAGFSRWEILSDFTRAPLARAGGQMQGFAWRD